MAISLEEEGLELYAPSHESFLSPGSDTTKTDFKFADDEMDVNEPEKSELDYANDVSLIDEGDLEALWKMVEKGNKFLDSVDEGSNKECIRYIRSN